MFKNGSTLGRYLCIALLTLSVKSFATEKNGLTNDKNQPSFFTNPAADAPLMRKAADSIYDLIGLGNYGLERNVFFNGYKGFQFLEKRGELKKTHLLTICDYSQSSNNKRLYVIDIESGRLLFNTYVSHGKNSGEEYATSFSNLDKSNKSSLGFMVTGETYIGKAGLSLRFDGMEQGINNNVRKRNIVFHGSKFVNERVMDQRGVIGNSLGCPAVPFGEHKKIIDVIKGGSCFFINHPDDWYVMNSNILNSHFDLELANEAMVASQPAVK